jgi:ABC-2 type transport system permease protein
MKYLKIAWNELKINRKGLLIFSILMALFFFWFTSMFDPDLFGDMQDLISGYPEVIQRMIGGSVSLTIFTGFINVYLFSLSWFYFGIYFMMKISQDIPKEIEDKTIDIILSKPIKRWKFVIGKFLRHIVSAGLLTLLAAVGVFTGIFIFPNVNPNAVFFSELIVTFIWLFVFLVALISTGLFFSTFLTPRKSLGLTIGLIIFFYIIGTYSQSFGESLEFLKYLSIFNYFETSNLLVNQVWDNILINNLILIGYSIGLVVFSVIIFNKRDIPV